MRTPNLRTSLALLVVLLAGCASVSRREGAENVQSLLATRVPGALDWRQDAPSDAPVAALVSTLTGQPLTPASAFAVAQLRNPQMAAEYARLGLAQADVVEASRIGNPGFSISALHGDGSTKVTSSIGLAIGDLILLPARKRLADAEYRREQQQIAQRLVDLAHDTAQAWFAAASAQQVAAMREAVSDAAAASALLAERYYAAGNLSELELRLEQAAASEARIAATSARAKATAARFALNTRMGLSGTEADAWTLQLPMAAPVASEDPLDALLRLADQNRLDLVAAREEAEILSDALAMVRRWRLLGSLELGVEREREADGARLTGPTLSLAIPLFNQGQAAIARAEARLEIARADLSRRELEIDNDVRLGAKRVEVLRAIAEDYRSALVPQRESAVRLQGQRNDFMLIGAFELLRAKQQEFDAYQAYLESVRDYWQARDDLSRAIGTGLPSDASIHVQALGVDAILDTPAPDPHAMHHGGHAGQAMQESAQRQDAKPVTESAVPAAAGHDKHEMHKMHDMHDMQGNQKAHDENPAHDEHSDHDEHDKHDGGQP